MYIHRIILKDVPGLPDRDLTFFDDWTGKSLQNVLITGPNGTGKTTMLRVIAGLWSDYGTWLLQSQVGMLLPRNVRRGGLVAMEVRDFAQDPVWFFSARDTQNHEQLLSRISDNSSILIGEVRGNPNSQVILPGFQVDPVDLSVSERPIKRPAATHVELMPLVNESVDWPTRISTLAHQLQLGVATDGESLPNIVFLRAESRQVVRSRWNSAQRNRPESLFRWLAQYEARERETDLEIMLRNLKIRDPKWFHETLEHINVFLRQNGKHLVDFDDNLRLRVLADQKFSSFDIEELSSGEQQCLILIFMISRWLMRGGIVLIDEPDLHMHGSWQRALVHELEQLVQEKNGQLIVTSHSPTLWEEYNERQRFNLEVELQR